MPTKNSEAETVSPSMKCSTADPSPTPMVPMVTASRAGCAEDFFVTSPRRPAK